LGETEQCTECKSKNILYDELNGEAVCIDCGLVLETIQYTPPPDRIPKNVPNNPIAYTSVAVGTKTASHQRLELNVAYIIEHVVQKLNFPKTTTLLAINFVCRLRRAMRQQNQQNTRFTATELTALSIWTTLKQIKYPLNYKEFTKKIEPFVGEVHLMKIENRALHFIDNVPRISDIPLVSAHINKLVNTLETKEIINSHYAHILCKYAIELVHAKPDLVKGHKAELSSASAVFAADGLIAEYFTLRVFATYTSVGAGNLSVFAEIFKRFAPPVPKESAAIHFTENLFRGIF